MSKKRKKRPKTFLEGLQLLNNYVSLHVQKRTHA